MENKIDNTIRISCWLLLALSLAAVLSARLRLLEIPLERDEGEYAYIGQLMLHGIPPYKLAYSMKLPGTAAAYALIMAVFGQTGTAIHLGLLIVNFGTVGVIFFLGRSLWNETAGLVAASSYAILSTMPYVLGLASHATHFVVLSALCGALLLVKNTESKKRLFAGGLLFGFAFLMKQPGLFFILFGAFYLFWIDYIAHTSVPRIILRNAIFISGAIAPFAAMCICLWFAGVFPRFWFWVVDYARQYGSRVSLSQGFQVFAYNFADVVGTSWPLWLVALVGFPALIFKQKKRKAALFVGGLFLASALAISPGLYFRPHYFVLLLPAISFLTALAVTGATDFINRKSLPPAIQVAPLIIFGIALAWPVWAEKDFLFQRPVIEAAQMVNGTNPFAEAKRIGEFLRDHTVPTDTIAVFGSEPEIYFYSQRHSATGYIYTYALMETQLHAHQMQLEMIREIEASSPKYFIFVASNKSWLPSGDSDKFIFRWASEYCGRNYDEVGLVNITEDATEYYLSGVPPAARATTEHILIYKRKT